MSWNYSLGESSDWKYCSFPLPYTMLVCIKMRGGPNLGVKIKLSDTNMFWGRPYFWIEESFIQSLIVSIRYRFSKRKYNDGFMLNTSQNHHANNFDYYLAKDCKDYLHQIALRDLYITIIKKTIIDFKIAFTSW